MIAIRTFVYRLYPTRAQHMWLEQTLVDQLRLYNAALEERIGAWRNARQSIGLNDQTRSLTEIRSFDPAYGGVGYDVSKWTLKRVDDAFKAFFARAKRGGKGGFPRFRPAGRWRSFGYHQMNGLRVRDNRLLLVGMIGALRCRMHHPVPAGAVPKSAVFTREGGIWRVALSVAINTPAADAPTSSLIGVDVGVNYLAVTSQGVHYANVRARSQREAALRQAQRAVARGVRGSKRRRKTVARLAALQRTVRNHRTTHMHDVANAIVRSSPIIAVEALRVKNMTRSARGTVQEPGTNVRQKAGLNRALADAAPARLIAMLTYKAESAGGLVVKVDPKYTSQTCSSCGVRDPAQAGPVRYRCRCGHDQHRDHNAAINIKQRGITALHEAARRLEKHNVADYGERASRKTDLGADLSCAEPDHDFEMLLGRHLNLNSPV